MDSGPEDKNLISPDIVQRAQSAETPTEQVWVLNKQLEV